MKTLLYTIGISLTLMACKPLCNLTKEEQAKFETKGDTIYYNKEAFAYFTHIEYEYYRGDKRVEVSLTQLSKSTDCITDELVDYVHLKHPKVKVEVKIPYHKFD